MLSANPHTATGSDLSPATSDAAKFRDRLAFYSLLPWRWQRKSNEGYSILLSTHNHSVFKISLLHTPKNVRLPTEWREGETWNFCLNISGSFSLPSAPPHLKKLSASKMLITQDDLQNMKMVQDHLAAFPAGVESSSIDWVAQVRHLWSSWISHHVQSGTNSC